MMHRRTFLGAAASAALTANAFARDDRWQKDFDAFVEDGLATAHIPGMSVAMVRDDKVLLARGYGYADVAAARRVDANTVFHIASVSKTVTGAAMMLLQQDGAFRLDDPIAHFVDFPVVHPLFPEEPITFRQLFTHTSGISDENYEGFTTAGDPTIGLRDFLVGYLSPHGKWYDPAKCYGAKPGTAWSYSNVAVALLGYLAGRVGPDGLGAVTRKRLFDPLGMRSTAWTFAAIGTKDIAKPYAFRDARYVELPVTGYPDWPAGLLRTTANDFAKFLTLFTARRRRVLSAETMKTILTPSPVSPQPGNEKVRQGLSWILVEDGSAHLAGHHGGDPGAGSVALFDAEAHAGALCFANVEPDRSFKVFQDEVAKRLLARARVMTEPSTRSPVP